MEDKDTIRKGNLERNPLQFPSRIVSLSSLLRGEERSGKNTGGVCGLPLSVSTADNHHRTGAIAPSIGQPWTVSTN